MAARGERGESRSVRLQVRGRVQGVGFRYFVLCAAEPLGLCGWVRNRPDGTVEARAEGPAEAVEAWIDAVRQGPPWSRVDDVEIAEVEAGRAGGSFEVRR